MAPPQNAWLLMRSAYTALRLQRSFETTKPLPAGCKQHPAVDQAGFCRSCPALNKPNWHNSKCRAAGGLSGFFTL